MTHAQMVSRRRLTERTLDYEWPEELRQLWNAARELRFALDTLEVAQRAARKRMDNPRADALLAAEDTTAAALRRVEELAAPLLREREG